MNASVVISSRDFFQKCFSLYVALQLKFDFVSRLYLSCSRGRADRNRVLAITGELITHHIFVIPFTHNQEQHPSKKPIELLLRQKCCLVPFDRPLRASRKPLPEALRLPSWSIRPKL